MNNRPIGIFDSGLGGLTVVKEITKILPNEDVVYLGDTARVPYGTRSKETIIKFSLEDADFLIKKKVKCIVIACNTASALAGDVVKKKLKIPVFEVITGAVENALVVTKNRKIGVIGTKGTIGSRSYQNALIKIGQGVKVFDAACPLFVPFIEEGETKSPALRIVAKKYLSALKKAKIDTLIMGCTHYPIIRDVIEDEVDHHRVKLIDPGQSEAKKVFEYLDKNKMLNSKKTKGKKTYFVTDLTPGFVKMAEMFLGEKIREKLSKVVL